MAPPHPFTQFKLLSFDCFATLIDYYKGIWEALQPLLSRLPTTSPLKHDRQAAVKQFNDWTHVLEAKHPTMLYSDLLAQGWRDFAKDIGVQDASDEDARTFGNSIGQWEAFPDTIKALEVLRAHYKLVILSNVDRDSFDKTLRVGFKGFKFDAVYTAEEIGSYKPDLNNFHYLREHAERDLEVKPEDMLHVAQSLKLDHVPAKELGMESVWISRGNDKGVVDEDLVGKVAFKWSYPTLGAFAAAVEGAFAEEAVKAHGKD